MPQPLYALRASGARAATAAKLARITLMTTTSPRGSLRRAHPALSDKSFEVVLDPAQRLRARVLPLREEEEEEEALLREADGGRGSAGEGEIHGRYPPRFLLVSASRCP